MLKIDVENSHDKLKFILCGKLVEPWVAELKAESQQLVQGVGNRRIIVDLKQTTNIEDVEKGVRFKGKLPGLIMLLAAADMG